MNIVLCSQKESVLRKWQRALQEGHRTYEASNYEAVLRLLKKATTDLLLLHRAMVDDTQLKKMLSAAKDCKIFVLSDRPNNREGISFLRLGCSGYSNTYIAPKRLDLAVRTVQSGLVWTGTALMQHLLSVAMPDLADDELLDEEDLIDSLSKREYQVAALVAEGLTNKKIAERLNITERTVKAHVSSIYQKTEVNNRIALAKLF